MYIFGFFLRDRLAGVLWAISILYALIPSPLFAQHQATTTLRISICGNNNTESTEVCDILPNAGGYSTSTINRTCEPGCQAFGPYCGDSILQPVYSETCDDGNNVSGDLCDALCVQEAPPGSGTPTTTGLTGGSSGQGGSFVGLVPFRADTKVVIEGKAYPLTTVNILKDGQVVGVTQTESDASFRYESGALTPGPATFGFWARDRNGTRSITFTTTFQVIQNAVTTLSGILLPPTIDAKEKKVKQGDPIHFFGQTVPGADVEGYLDSDEDPRVSATTTNGDWSIAMDTTTLENEKFHSAKALFAIPGVPTKQKSGFSASLSFYVGEQDVGDLISADINKDGKVNLVDFSILLFNWGTTEITCDLNQDGKVNLTDFSILLFNWTG